MRILAAFSIALICAQPGAAMADEVAHLVQRYGPQLDGCLAAAGQDTALARNCVGVAADACMQKEQDGQTTVGMSRCLMSEAQVWDGLLNAEYQNALAHFAALDTADRLDFPEVAVRVDRLRAAQRAWLAFYDAECALDYAIWGSGTMRQIAGADCALEMKAARSLDLAEKRRTMQ